MELAGLEPATSWVPRVLLTDRSWLLGFGIETAGFLLYVAALKLASLALVQSVAAGGIGVLAFLSWRVTGRPLGRCERLGVLLSILGLVALGISLSLFARAWLIFLVDKTHGVWAGARSSRFRTTGRHAFLTHPADTTLSRNSSRSSLVPG